MFGLRFPELVMMAAIGVVVFLPAFKMLSKAGYNGLLCLLLMVPFVNLAFTFWFAFSKWPIEKELDALRAGRAPMPTVPVGQRPGV